MKGLYLSHQQSNPNIINPSIIAVGSDLTTVDSIFAVEQWAKRYRDVYPSRGLKRAYYDQGAKVDDVTIEV